MPQSLTILLPILVAIPGLFIPLYVISRMAAMVADKRKPRLDKNIARVTVLLMLVVMGFSLYAASAIHAVQTGISSSLP